MVTDQYATLRITFFFLSKGWACIDNWQNTEEGEEDPARGVAIIGTHQDKLKLGNGRLGL